MTPDHEIGTVLSAFSGNIPHLCPCLNIMSKAEGNRDIGKDRDGKTATERQTIQTLQNSAVVKSIQTTQALTATVLVVAAITIFS